MPDILAVENHGPLITSSNYWQSAACKAGKIIVSVNAGAIRILLPPTANDLVTDCQTCRYVVLSRGPWPAADRPDAFEFMFEDNTDSPVAFHLSVESFAGLIVPTDPPKGQEWVVSLWTERKGRPHKSLERRCHYRRVKELPCMEPWQG